MKVCLKALLVLSVLGNLLIASAQSTDARLSFEIDKLGSNGKSIDEDGEVTVSAGSLRNAGGPFTMNISSGFIDFKTKEFNFGGNILNKITKNNSTHPISENLLVQIGFDGSSGHPNNTTKFSAQQIGNDTKIVFTDMAIHASFPTYYEAGYRGLADVELVINQSGKGTFKVTMTKIINAYQPYLPSSIINLNNLPKNFPSIANAKGLLAQGETKSGTSMSIKFPTPEEFQVRFSTFIPGDRIIGPPTSFCNPPLGKAPRQLYYNGNNRSFSASSPLDTDFKIEQTVTLVTQIIGPPNGSGIKEGTNPQNRVGLTKEYASDALSDGKIDKKDDDGKRFDCSLLHNWATASDEDIHVTVKRLNPQKVSVRFYGAAKDPLVPFAPSIDWDITITIDDTGSVTRYVVSADHDGFPAFEVYIGKRRVYDIWPGNPPYDDLFGPPSYLFPPVDIHQTRSGSL
jgi:Protein of unknown function (DUF3238)